MSMEYPVSTSSCPNPGPGGGDHCPPVTPKASLGGGSTLPTPSPFCLPSADTVGGSGCLCLDQSIHLGGGGEIRASEVSVGTILKGIDCSGSPAQQTVTQIQSLSQPCLEIAFGDKTLRCSVGHLLMTPDLETVRAGDISEGDELLDESLQRVKITSTAEIGEHPVVTWLCVPNHNYFAQGILHHNKLTYFAWMSTL